MLLRGLKTVKDNDKSTKLLVTRKCSQAITDAQRKVVQKYYFHPANKKFKHKHLQKRFLQEFQHFSLQSIISKLLSTNFGYLDTVTSRLGIKKQSHTK